MNQERFKDVIECKATQKTKDQKNRKQEIWDQIAERAFEGKRTSSQLQVCWSNLKARTLSKERANQAEMKKTGGGLAKLHELTPLELTILSIANVATPVPGVRDSNEPLVVIEDVQNTQKNDSVTLLSPLPKISKTPFGEDELELKKRALIDVQIESIRSNELRKSHLNSIKCLTELMKLPHDHTGDLGNLMTFHKSNITKTGQKLISKCMVSDSSVDPLSQGEVFGADFI